MSQESKEQETPAEQKIMTVRKLLAENLAIPIYQRPYKWTTKHVRQLFDDIATFKDKSAYRLGTIVFHQEGETEGEKKNIVDGQQRTITLLLTVHALINDRKYELERNDLKDQLSELENSSMVNPTFTSDISKFNIYNNYHEISRIISRSDFTEEHIDFLLNRCEVVTFSLTNISEAFQFFDSQNARGRDLEPHDLLKAYHLREFNDSPIDRELKAKTIETWEESETKELANLFSQYLYRIRNWARGESARYFGKDDAPLFKGVNIETISSYPYVQHLRIVHNFVDHYNVHCERKIDGQSMAFPFHFDQTIINGRRFFEMIVYYREKVAEICNKEYLLKQELNGYAKKILETIDEYEGRYRTGDRHVRNMFDCLLIYYIDKFGSAELSRAIEKIFIWAYSLRLQRKAVQLASCDNHVVRDTKLFALLKNSSRPSDFISYNLPVMEEPQSTKTEKIKKLFEDMKYLKKEDNSCE